jgi:hypothetical protein
MSPNSLSALAKPAWNASALILCALTVVLTLGANQSQTVASLNLLERAADPNPTLQSYIASATLAARLNGPIPIHETFIGTVYYQKPNRKIIFENVSGPLSRFKAMTSTTPTYQQALAQYAVTPLVDDGAVSKYLLVPRKQGSSVTNLTVGVDDKTALIVNAVWIYNNGGSLTLDQTYQSVDTVFEVPAWDNIEARFPGYSVDGQMTFSNYQVNASIPASVFETEH